jgi:hypothetical protein
MQNKRKFKTETKVSGATIGISVDTSNFFRGFSLTQNRIDELKLEVARMVIPFYKRLILRTPVWRGTARLHWDLRVDNFVNKSGYGRARRMGTVKRDLIDSGLEMIAANKAGKPSAAKFYLTRYPDAAKASNKFKYGSEKKPFKQGRPKTPIGTQSQYGMMTNSVRAMIDSAERNIQKNFKVTSGGPDSLFNKRSATTSIITISNDLPYIKFLEGPGSEYGAAYTRGSHWWKEKEGDSDFVRPGESPTNAAPEALGQYRKGFIKRGVANLKGEFTRFVSSNNPGRYRIR